MAFHHGIQAIDRGCGPLERPRAHELLPAGTMPMHVKYNAHAYHFGPLPALSISCGFLLAV